MNNKEINFLKFNEKFNDIEKEINRIIHNVKFNNINKLTSIEYISNYNKIYELLEKNRYIELIYERYEKIIINYYNIIINELENIKSNNNFIKSLIDNIKDIFIIIKLISKIFYPLDNYNKYNYKDKLNIISHKLFIQIIYNKYEKKIKEIIYYKVNKDRNNNFDNTIKILINYLLIINEKNYKDIEDYIINSSKEYFINYIRNLSKSDDIISNIDNIIKEYKNQENIINFYLTKTNKNIIFNILEKEIENFNNELINRNILYYYISNNMIDKIANYYNMLKIVNMREIIEDNLNEILVIIIINKIDEYLKNKDIKKMIENNYIIINIIINEVKNYKEINNKIFENYYLFENGLKKLLNNKLEEKIKKKINIEIDIYHLFTNYINNLIKKTYNEEKLKNKLNDILYIASFLDNQELYIEFSKQYLLNRLLLSEWLNKDNKKKKYELICLSIMKIHLDKIKISKYEKIINEILLNNNNKKFRKYLKDNLIEIPFKIDIKVLNILNCLSLYNNIKYNIIKLPDNYNKYIKYFNNYYSSKTQNRKLQYIYNISSVNIIARFKNGNKELIVSLYHGLILEEFNNHTSIKISDLCNNLNITFETLKKYILTLCIYPHNFLYIDNHHINNYFGNNINNLVNLLKLDDILKVNEDFFSLNKKIRILNNFNILSFKDNKENNKENNNDINKDKILILEALIVRIMKREKIILLNDIILEITKTIDKKYNITIKDIKNKINDLINREYIEMDKIDNNILKYII